LTRATLLVAALSGAVAARALAQADTTRDSTAARAPTVRDTLPRILPTFALPVPAGPLPRGARYTFTADSLLFTSARTLSDLLGRIPGVYVARGGWFGQAEPVLYGGRGPVALEVYWDGVPYLPLGRDSVYLDPARIPLAPLERLDVIVLPAAVQAYLVTARPHSTTPVTHIGIATGDQEIAGYRGGYGARTRSGLGLSLMADDNSVPDGSSAATTTTFKSTDLWLKAEYVPPEGRLGASFQLLSSNWRRHEAAGRVDPWQQQRRDRSFAFFVASRADGLGFRLAGTMASTTVDQDSAVAERTLSQTSLELSHTWPRANLTVTGRFGATGAPGRFEARGGWVAVSGVTLAAAVRHATYAGNRSGDRAHLTAGVRLPLGFSARGELAWMKDVQAPLLITDTIRQQATDVAGWLRWDHPRVVIEVGRGRRDPFTPLRFAAGIKTVDHLGQTPRTDFIAAHASVRPLPGVELSGWYFDPIVGGGDFEPPHHARLSASFYSKFWRVFRSGIFALRAEVAMESWSGGLSGRDSSGVQLTLGGASFAETNLELQLGGATLFWIIRNSNGMRGSYVDGLGYPKRVQLYGARWFFTN
jgi:hypothetical protein